jgi:hypothetical protein
MIAPRKGVSARGMKDCKGNLERFVEHDVLAVVVGSESHGHRERRVLLVAVPNTMRGDARDGSTVSREPRA